MNTRTERMSVSVTSPLAITMLLHFYAVCEPYIKRNEAEWPRAQLGIVEWFLELGLIAPTVFGYQTTPKGDKLVKTLLLRFDLLMLGGISHATNYLVHLRLRHDPPPWQADHLPRERTAMQVTTDGVEYTPRHTADKGGRVKSLAQLFTEGRKHMHLTLEQARKQSGVSGGKIVAAECGNASLETAVILAEFYGIPLDQIARAVRRTSADALLR